MAGLVWRRPDSSDSAAATCFQDLEGDGVSGARQWTGGRLEGAHRRSRSADRNSSREAK